MNHAIRDGEGGAIGPAIEVRAGASRVQLFSRYGTWRDEGGGNAYTIRDQRHAADIIAATVAASGLSGLVFDFDHRLADADVTPGNMPAGWWSEMTADNTGIWAERVQWTPGGTRSLAVREYRYASPYFAHDRDGEVLRIVSAGLTPTADLGMLALASSVERARHAAIGQLTAAELEVADRLCVTPQAYLAARSKRDVRVAASSLASAVDAVQLSASEQSVCHAFGLSPAEFVGARSAR